MGKIEVDIVCPLYNASNDFDNLINGINGQKNISIKKLVFPVTESIDNTYKLAKSVPNATIIKIKKEDFSHSLTREKMVYEYTSAPIIIFLTQDVILSDKNALYLLASSINEHVIHAFARQLTKYKGIEKYIRDKNYPNESYIVENKDIEKMQIKAFYTSDACAAYNRAKFIELDGFDHKDFKVSEDMYFARKALLNGYSIKYCAESIVKHSHKYTLKELYKRYYDIGLFFSQNPEFNQYKSTNSGVSLALYVLKEAIKHMDLKALIAFFPNMITRYFGKKRGEKSLLNK